MTPPFFQADSISHSFGARGVLKSATAWARPGEIAVLFGRNGCGKSTLLKAAVGVIRAHQGVVLYDGEAYLRPRLARLARRGLFYLPDRNLLSRRQTVREQMKAVQWHFGGSRAEEAIETLKLPALLDQPGVELSGGEQRRAEVALAWIREPRCLLADEPFAGINPSDGELIAGALRGLAERGCAILVTGHEVRQLLDLADEVIWMAGGTTHGLGSPVAAVENHQFRREYLGMMTR